MTRIPKPKNNNEKGYTLIEVLVASALFLIFTVAMLTLFIKAVRSYRFGEAKIRLISEARVGLDRISRDMKRASFVLYPDETVLQGDGSSIIVFSSVEGRTTLSGDTNIIAYKLEASNNIRQILYRPDFDIENPGNAEALDARVICKNVEHLNFRQEDVSKPQVISIRLRTLELDNDQVFLMTKIFLRH